MNLTKMEQDVEVLASEQNQSVVALVLEKMQSAERANMVDPKTIDAIRTEYDGHGWIIKARLLDGSEWIIGEGVVDEHRERRLEQIDRMVRENVWITSARKVEPMPASVGRLALQTGEGWPPIADWPALDPRKHHKPAEAA